jgi:sodium-independent sulfate anion transporter 11
MVRKISLNKIKERVVEDYRTDPNLNRAKRWVGPFCRAIPPFAADYVTDKLPIAQWLPHYDYRWLYSDFIAGITIGVMLIPQGLAYAKIATVPVANGLYASWFPSALYLFMGTSKGEFIPCCVDGSHPLSR